MSKNIDREWLKAKAYTMVLDELENGYSEYLCDIHNEVFNTINPWEIDESYAKEILYGYDVFDAIQEIVEYENFNFGCVNTDFSDARNILIMLMYIIGEEVISDVMECNEFFRENWDNSITDDNREKLIISMKA